MAGLDLRDYQLEAIDKLQNGSILCGGVGSGKSITAIAYYFFKNGGELLHYVAGDNYMPMSERQDLYIITTARKRDTFEWEKDLSYFLLSPRADENLYSDEIRVVIDSWNNVGKYVDVENAFFIFDEQRVVGSGAWVKAFLKITKKNDWILLSATPGDTWQDYIPVFVANGFYKNRTEFSREHIIWDCHANYPKIKGYMNTGRLIKHRNDILVNMDFKRQTKSHHENIFTEYDIMLYKRLLKERFNVWEDKPIENAAELCYCLRKAASSNEGKQVAVLNLLECHERAIIFYNFNYELDILRNLGYAPDTVVAEWNGQKHEPVPTSERWVYLVQYSAGCEGWNCIATDTVIFYSPNYSYKVMTQAAGRIDRLNTPYEDLYYYHLLTHSGIDNAIRIALVEKRNFNEGHFANSYNIKFS